VLAEDELRLVLVVTPTAKGDVLHRRGSTSRVGFDVMELQERAFRASLPSRADEAALAIVSLPSGSVDVAGPIAGSASG
jgi:hypothetical protein